AVVLKIIMTEKLDQAGRARRFDRRRQRRCQMEAHRVELFLVRSRQTLKSAVVIELIERIGAALYATIEEVARIGRLAIVSNFREAAVDGKIGGRGSVAIGVE